VYINGLPPNFPEEDLLAMTKPFGEVISVRTFTRHVSDKPSGYGFVLFGSVDAAEKCIESLRKYRNLHPSYSKQIHKIPGTSYAAAHADSAITVPQTSTEASDSFKSKMERLKDMSSTNLYMEGLPLSIDEETLQALVQPYRIMSSRFFRTRLSNPPRIIAFVRLESRQAAEDIIERLHGRMVRGWRDSGSRISVRFADTSEQRELRRVERINRDGENSPARLTMAQAALLNLKGTQLDSNPNSRLPSPNFGVVSLAPVIGTTPSPVEPAFIATQVGYRPLPPPIGLHHQQQAGSPTLRNMNVNLPHNTALYDGSTLGLNSRVADHVGVGLRPHEAELSQMQMQMAAMDLGSTTKAQHGFTPMERLILHAHEQRQQQEALMMAVQNGHGVRPPSAPRFNPAATEFSPSVATLGRFKAPSAASSTGTVQRQVAEFMPSMSEQDFHARGQQQQHAKGLKLDQESRVQFTRQRNQTHAEARAQAEAEAAHARSTTVPSHYLNTSMGRGIHGSLHSPTMPSHNTVPGTPDISQQNSHNVMRSPAQQSGASGKNFTSNISNNNSTLSNTKPRIGSLGEVASSQQQNTRIDTAPATLRNHTSGSHSGDDEDDASSLDSPALSYSARTPASLSPATPFSAFGETFEGPPMKGDVGLGMAVGVQVVDSTGAKTGTGKAVTVCPGAGTGPTTA